MTADGGPVRSARVRPLLYKKVAAFFPISFALGGHMAAEGISLLLLKLIFGDLFDKII